MNEKQPARYIAFSFDDGTLQDIRLIKLLDRYGIKATFNLNSGLLGQPGQLVRNGQTIDHTKIPAKEVRFVYQGHEIASHSLTHPRLTNMPAPDILRQVEEDRLRLSDLAGYEVYGFAYPCGGQNYTPSVADLLEKQTGVRYARTIESSFSFEPPQNPYMLCPTAHFLDFEHLHALWQSFLQGHQQNPQIFLLWGHSFELDCNQAWDKFEVFLQTISQQRQAVFCTVWEAISSTRRQVPDVFEKERSEPVL